HPFPVVLARTILATELHPPRLGGSAFGSRDMGLELDRIGPCIGDRIDKGVREPETAIMGLGHFGDDQASLYAWLWAG
ncbi:MAG: hypothetical protein QNI86_12840, partial [Halieaceae bacterium]|nr:hypothetical protein [Halieaceae bacterium]